MKKIIFGIFAHPDDEAFGPAGTLLMEKAAGNEVHLICATAGESGVNPDQHDALAIVRLEEWRNAGELIGADSMNYLGFKDGYLCNNDYHELADKITTIIERLTTDRDDIEIELMSMDHNGVTGHLDHILVGRVATYVFYVLKEKNKKVTRLRLACLPRARAKHENCEWLYMDAGRTPDEVGEIIDAREHLDEVIAIMRTHHSQRADGERHISVRGDDVAVNHFLIIE
jgi:LmbE family N-acetylglucosaminyl deacetylase